MIIKKKLLLLFLLISMPIAGSYAAINNEDNTRAHILNIIQSLLREIIFMMKWEVSLKIQNISITDLYTV
jgi:hypothetical protein